MTHMERYRASLIIHRLHRFAPAFVGNLADFRFRENSQHLPKAVNQFVCKTQFG